MDYQQEHCRSYALEAERKMGEMLASSELQHGARGIGKSGVTPSNPTPTLKELGLSKRESSEAQTMASIPQEVFNEVKEGENPLAIR
jgi:hypothetical protein